MENAFSLQPNQIIGSYRIIRPLGVAFFRLLTNVWYDPCLAPKNDGADTIGMNSVKLLEPFEYRWVDVLPVMLNENPTERPTKLKKLLKPFRGKIKTQEEYDERLRVFSALMDKGEALSEEESDYMDLLGTLLEDFEHSHHPELDNEILNGVTPIDAIRWAMDRHGLLQKDLSPYMGSPQLVSSVMNGNRSLSKTMIVKLHEGLGIPYEQLLRCPEKTHYRKVAMF